MDSMVGWHSEDMRMLPMWNVSLQDRWETMWMGDGIPGVFFGFKPGDWASPNRTPLTVNQMVCLYFDHPQVAPGSFLIFGVWLW